MLCSSVMLDKDNEDGESAPATTGYYARAGDYTAESLRALKLDQGAGGGRAAAAGAASHGGAGEGGPGMNATFVADANQIHEARKRRVGFFLRCYGRDGAWLVCVAA